MNQPWVYMCPPYPKLSSHLPPHPIPQDRPSAPALSTLSHASNLDWWSVSHMVIYVSVLFQIFNEYFLFFLFATMLPEGLPCWLRGKESTCQCRRCRFDPWVMKIPWRRKWQLNLLLFLPGKAHEQRKLVGYSSRDRRVRHDMAIKQQHASWG